MLLMFMLTNFSPPIKLVLLVPNEEDPDFFCQGIKSILKNGKIEKITFWANPGTVCILQSFIVRFCDKRKSIVNPHLTIV